MRFILAVHFPNGTNSQSDRKAIQAEIDELTTEIDRVAETTKFNETYLLKGDSKTSANANFMKSGMYKKTANLYVEGSDNALADANALKKALDEGKKVYTDTATNGQTSAILAKEQTDYAYVSKLYDKDGKEVTAEQIAEAKDSDGTTTATNYYTTDKGNAGAIAITAADAKTNFTQSYEVNGALSFNLHVGADSSKDNKISVNIDSMSSAGIGVKNLNVGTEEDATNAINRIGEAIQKVSSQRSSLGAIQNRLEHTIANLDNVVENTTAAESRIRDTDMAKEMVNFSKNNILAQAGQSMLAQANQSNQGVLSLLQ